METGEIVQLLGAWSLGAEPLYRRLSHAIQEAIARGDIPPETRLPAERVIARALAVSRGTVVEAYNCLRDDGWVVSRRGSGTWVLPRPLDETDRRRAVAARMLARSPFFASLLDAPEAPFDLATGAASTLPDLPPDFFAISGDDLAPLLVDRGYAPLGIPVLRQAIADRLTAQGLPTVAGEVLVTTGAQQAITLLTAAFVRRGDTVVVESPTYFGALDAFRAAGVHILSVPISRHGIEVDVLRDRMPGAQLVYVMPTCQNPTGTIMPTAHRRTVATLAARSGVPVIEDHTFAELCLEGDAPPPIAAYAEGGSVITIGSLSKVCWAGLRIGWIRAPRNIIDRVARVKVVADLGTSVLSQVIAARLVARMGDVVALRRAELHRRLALLEDLLATLLPDWTWEQPAGGFFLWVRLPTGDARAFAQVALRHGVLLTPGTVLSADDAHADRVRLPFLLPPEQLTLGVRRLADAWAVYLSMPCSYT